MLTTSGNSKFPTCNLDNDQLARNSPSIPKKFSANRS